MSGFAQEYLNESVSENFLTPPKPGTNPTGPPYTNSSNHILKQTLEARDATQAILTETQALVDGINAGSIGGVDLTSLPARP